MGSDPKTQLDLYSFQSLDFDVIRSAYRSRAIEEASNRSIPYNPTFILEDVNIQLNKLQRLDNGTEASNVTWKYISDFLSLYASRNANNTAAAWATVGEQLHFLISLLFELSGSEREMIRDIELDKLMQFSHLQGANKGAQIRLFKEKLIETYGHLSEIPPKIQKRKNLSRIFWSIVSPQNLDEIESFDKSNISI